MTYEQAQEILKVPKFGDPLHIEAVARVEAEPELNRMRAFLIGKGVACWACNGRADNCKVCRPDGTVEITPELVMSWDEDALASVYEEVTEGPCNG